MGKRSVLASAKTSLSKPRRSAGLRLPAETALARFMSISIGYCTRKNPRKPLLNNNAWPARQFTRHSPDSKHSAHAATHQQHANEMAHLDRAQLFAEDVVAPCALQLCRPGWTRRGEPAIASCPFRPVFLHCRPTEIAFAATRTSSPQPHRHRVLLSAKCDERISTRVERTVSSTVTSG